LEVMNYPFLLQDLQLKLTPEIRIPRGPQMDLFSVNCLLL
jgi:hypothetical protein